MTITIGGLSVVVSDQISTENLMRVIRNLQQDHDTPAKSAYQLCEEGHCDALEAENARKGFTPQGPVQGALAQGDLKIDWTKYAVRPEVIDLVEPHIRAKLTKAQNRKLTVVLDDVFNWPVPKRAFDVIYFDIWAGQSTDDLMTMKQLHMRYRRALRPDGWMESWRREALRDKKRRER